MSTPAKKQATRADYGLDAPGIVRNLLLGSAAAILGAVLLARLTGPGELQPVLGVLWGTGLASLGGALLMTLSSRVGKLRLRDRLLDRLSLAPEARILDVGCGHGLLLIGAARRAARGRAVGLDLWSQVDQGSNSREATLANAEVEGVADRVEVHDGDMRMMPFADESFDAVVSSLALHNLPGRAERSLALAEIARVLRPGGQVAIVDIAHVRSYGAELRRAGFREISVSVTPWIYPPARVLVGRK